MGFTCWICTFSVLEELHFERAAWRHCKVTKVASCRQAAHALEVWNLDLLPLQILKSRVGVRYCDSVPACITAWGMRK